MLAWLAFQKENYSREPSTEAGGRELPTGPSLTPCTGDPVLGCFTPWKHNVGTALFPFLLIRKICVVCSAAFGVLIYTQLRLWDTHSTGVLVTLGSPSLHRLWAIQ